MKLTYFYSATVSIQTDDLLIVCDPWFTQGAYDGSWFHFPRKIDNPIEDIGGEKVDYIYISHIHPDHYDPKFLHSFLLKYPSVKIIISDFNVNVLAREMDKDNIPFEIVSEIKYRDTSIKLFPCHSHKYDIDSALVIKDDKTVIANLNDNPYNEEQLNRIKEYAGIIDVALLPYAGAGPFPQTYYETTNTFLQEKMKEKEKRFIDEYLDFKNYLKPKKSLPFAGSYVLGGKLSYLNNYLGVPDATKILDFDTDAFILNDGGKAYFDTDTMKASDVRTLPYKKEVLDTYLLKISTEVMNYEKDFAGFNPDKIDFTALFKIAYKNALSHSLCKTDYYYCFFINDKYTTINTNPDKHTLEITDDVQHYSPRSEIYIDLKYLFGLLHKTYHWNNAEVGSHVMVRRYPDEFNRFVQIFLNYLHIELR